MAELNNRHDPTWLLLPVNNDRTAWRPFGLPVVLVTPHRRDPVGQPVPNSEILCLTVFIEDVQDEVLVTGHDNRVPEAEYDNCGLAIPDAGGGFEQRRYPDRTVYSEYVNAAELAAKAIPLPSLQYFRKGPSGRLNLDEPFTHAEAVEGDYFAYTSRGYLGEDHYPREAHVAQAADYIPYLPDADYYDFSAVALETEHLPHGRYRLVYQAEYFTRVRTSRGAGELLCIDITKTSLAVLKFPFNHPGEVLAAFHRGTPAAYLTSGNKSQDTTLAIYRPLTDALQDVYDEQSLLERLNWVHHVPNEAIPYLAALLGWDLPYYPDSLDNLRRTVLRNTSYLQESKGSRHAVTELFRLLGIEILLSNLWWSADGKLLIRPNQALGNGYQDQEITIRSVPQCEPLLADYRDPGFAQAEIPLLHRPQTMGGLDGFAALRDTGDVYLDAFLVEVDTPAHRALLEIVAQMAQDPSGYAGSHQTEPIKYQPVAKAQRATQDGSHLYQRTVLNSALLSLADERSGWVSIAIPPDSGIGGYSQIRVSNGQDQGVAAGPLGFGVSDVALGTWDQAPVLQRGVELLRDSNAVRLALSNYLDPSGDADLPPKRRHRAVFVFASYTRQELVVPESIRHLQSNRFDIQLLQAETIPPLAGQRTYLDANVLEFAMEFLDKVRAFHSLLNVMRLVLELTETYAVGGIEVGGDVQQRWDTEMGRLQVPPAILPRPALDNECDSLDPEKRGYKREDIVFRLRQLANLPEEHAAYRKLQELWTNTLGDTSGRDDPEVYNTTGPRIGAADPADRGDCKFNHLGQDLLTSYRYRDLRGIEATPGPNAAEWQAGAGAGPQLSPVDLADRGQYPGDGPATSSRNDTSAFGRFAREHSEYDEPLCEPDGVTDFIYRGRARDELLHRRSLAGAESVRPRYSALGLGFGSYWLYSAIGLEVLAGVARPARGSSTGRWVLTALGTGYLAPGTRSHPAQGPYLAAPYGARLARHQHTHLGKLYRAYGQPKHQSLHYSDQPRVSVEQSKHLALARPDLGLSSAVLHFPGCRFLSAEALPADYTSDEWQAKPWDDRYSSACGPAGSCSRDPGWLGAELVAGPDGDEYLVFDAEPYRLSGNGLPADIPSLGDHSTQPAAGGYSPEEYFPEEYFPEDYFGQPESSTQPAAGGYSPEEYFPEEYFPEDYFGQPESTPQAAPPQVAVALTPGLVVHSVRSAAPAGHPAIALECTAFQEADTLNTAAPLFRSHQECGTDYLDYSDGYPYETGLQPVTADQEDRNGAVFEPVPAQALFFLGDGYLVGEGHRLDGGCLLVDCGSTGDAAPLCSLELHRDQDGLYDWNQDQAWFHPRMVLQEAAGVGSGRLDGSVPTLFELLDGGLGGQILARLPGTHGPNYVEF